METETTTGTEAPADAAPPTMAEGVLEGGWGYIWAAYGITWAFLAGYAIYVTVRKTLSRRPRESTAE